MKKSTAQINGKRHNNTAKYLKASNKKKGEKKQ